HIQIALQGQADRFAVTRLLGRVENDDLEAFAVCQRLPQPGEQVGLHESDARLVEVGILPGEGKNLLIQVHANHLTGPAQRLGAYRKATGVTAQVEHALAATEAGQRLAIVALVEEVTGLVLAARRHAEALAMLGDGRRRRRLPRPVVERLLLLNMLLREPVELGAR